MNPCIALQRVNRACILDSRMKGGIEALSEKDRRIALAVFNAVREGYGENLISLAIFGSVARGAAKPESDFDILIVANKLVRGRMNRVREYLQIEKERIRPRLAGAPLLLSPVIKTPEEVSLGSPLFWDMTEDVIILLDREGFLEKHLLKVKERLTALRARKVQKGDGWYWILKESYTPGEVFEL